jgi:hypothetical protein
MWAGGVGLTVENATAWHVFMFSPSGRINNPGEHIQAERIKFVGLLLRFCAFSVQTNLSTSIIHDCKHGKLLVMVESAGVTV